MNDRLQPQIEALKCPQCGATLKPGGEDYITCQYCGSNLMYKRQINASGATEEAVVRGIRLKQFSYTDAEGTGLELFRMLVPVGWQFQGGCRWILDNPGMPAAVAFQISNPQGAEAFEVLPNMNFTWRNDPLSKLFTPKGTRSFGAEVCPAVSILEAFHEYVLPRYRGRAQNMQIINEELVPDLPKLARSEAAVSGGWAEGGKIRIRYTWQNNPLEEEIYGVVEVFRAPITSMLGMTEVQIWFIDFLFSFRASAGLLDATTDLFSAMIFSFQLNPQWYAAYKTIVQKLAQQQIQRIHHIGQIGQMLAQSGSQMREQNLNDWYARQEVYDRLSTDWSRTIRDVDAFMDPHRQEVVELPAGYGHAWANNLGEYILTEDPNFNPNQSSNQHWEPMEGQ